MELYYQLKSKSKDIHSIDRLIASMNAKKIGMTVEINNFHGDTPGGHLETEDQFEKRYGIARREKTAKERVTKKLKETFTCSRSKLAAGVQSVLPITRWLRRYKVKEWLAGDITGGITVGVVHLPQGLAYGLLASLPAVTGLYVSFFPVLAYAFFGSSRHLSVGTFAVVSLMVGTAIDELVPTGYCGDAAVVTTPSQVNETTAPTGDICSQLYNQRKIEVAIALSLAVAIVNFAMYILQLGIVTVYLSSHMITGFTCGAAFHVLTSQVSKLFGLQIPRKSGPLALIYTYIDIFSHLYQINWATVIVSVCCIIPLIIGKEINLRFKERLPFPLPWELVVVIFSDLASYFGYLNLNYGVSVVGEIPQGIVTSVPKVNDLGNVFLSAISIAIVSYTVTISLARMFATKHAYQIDSNQELLAFGVGNLVGSFFSCFPSATSLSRTVIWEETGGKSQLTGIISSAVILVTMLWIGPLFESLPEAALASIIVVNLKRMLRQFDQLPTLWKISKLDVMVWLVTWIGVILLGVDVGLIIGIVFSLFTVIVRTQITTGHVMTAVGDTGEYRNRKRFRSEVEKENPKIFVYQFPSPLYFANKERFLNQFYAELGFEPAMEIAKRKKRKAKQLKNVIANEGYVDHDVTDNHEVTSDNAAETTEKQPNGVSAITIEEISESIVVNRSEEILYVILEMKTCSFIDNDGMKCIRTLHKELKELGIRLLLSRCSENVRRCLHGGDFPPEVKEDEPQEAVFFISAEKAYSYAERNVAKSLTTAEGVNETVTRF